MRTSPETDIVAPEFPPRLDWVGAAFLRMDKQLGRPVLVEFLDTARINSLRTLPYLKEWHERYAAAGLRIIGVHSPGYSFGRDRAVAEAAIEQLEVPFPVVLDPDFLVWREYGNKGWPGRYVFDRRLRLRYIHYGEGDYDDCELVIQEVLAEADEDFQPPPALVEPLRPEDEPGVLLEPQTADIALPGDHERVELVRDWVQGPDYLEAADAGAAATVTFRAGSAWAVLSGDDVVPGLHETDGTVVAESPGLRLHGFQFTPLPPG
jgi:AhpC/TSA family